MTGGSRSMTTAVVFHPQEPGPQRNRRPLPPIHQPPLKKCNSWAGLVCVHTHTMVHTPCQATMEAPGQTPVSLQVQLFPASAHVCPQGHPQSVGRLGGGRSSAHVGESRWQELLPSGERLLLPESGKKCHYLERQRLKI